MPISRDEVSFTMDLTEELERVPKSKRREVKEKVGNLLLDKLKQDAASGRSAVDGQKWSGLSKDYKEFKRKKGKGTTANLKLTSAMFSNLTVRNTARGIKIEQRGGRKQRDKSFNHNFGDTLPKRQFLPNDILGEEFRPGIQQEVDSIVKAEQTLPEEPTFIEQQQQLERDLLKQLRQELAPTVEARLRPIDEE